MYNLLKNLFFLKCAGNFATTSGKAGSGWIFVTFLQITHYLLTIRIDFAFRRLMCLGGYICIIWIICIIYSTYVTYIHIGGMLSVTNCVCVCYFGEFTVTWLILFAYDSGATHKGHRLAHRVAAWC